MDSASRSWRHMDCECESAPRVRRAAWHGKQTSHTPLFARSSADKQARGVKGCLRSGNGKGSVARAHRQPAKRVLSALVQRDPLLKSSTLQVMHDMLGFVTEILFQTQNHRGVLQLWDGSDGSDVLGHQLVRLAHVCTHTHAR